MARERIKQSFTVPATSGSYAFERLTFGETASGQVQPNIEGITISVFSSVATSQVEVWLPRVDATAPYLDTDYTYSGWSVAASGALTMPLAGYTGVQVRVKSGGTSGTAVVSATVLVR